VCRSSASSMEVAAAARRYCGGGICSRWGTRRASSPAGTTGNPRLWAASCAGGCRSACRGGPGVALVGRRRAVAGVSGRGWRAGAEARTRRWLCVVWGIERLSRLISEGLVRGWALSAPSNTDRFWSVGYFDCTV
jgi:hypothetical protein